MELSDVEADFIELYFTGQYLGRADMWRLGMSLEDKCVFVRQKVEFAGIKAEVKNIYIKGKRVSDRKYERGDMLGGLMCSILLVSAEGQWLCLVNNENHLPK